MRNEYFTTFLPDHPSFNNYVIQKFFSLLDTEHANKTHLFNNRYENIYIPLSKINQIEVLNIFSKKYLAELFPELAINKLKSGFWFNLMMPGESTLPHTHDDDDEIFSAVYYLNVPENSGDLILHIDDSLKTITPQAGQFVFFSPTLKHEVSENRSNDYRLSVAFNFGN